MLSILHGLSYLTLSMTVCDDTPDTDKEIKIREKKVPKGHRPEPLTTILHCFSLPLFYHSSAPAPGSWHLTPCKADLCSWDHTASAGAPRWPE